MQVQRKRGLPNTVQIICKYCAHTVPRNWPQSFTKGPKREGIVHQIFGQNLNLKGSCFRQMAARGLANMLALQICQLNQQIIHGLHKTNGWTYDSNEQRQLTLKWGGGEDGGTKWNKHSLSLRFLKIISTSTIIVTSMCGWWRPRDHCFIGWNCFSTSKTAPTTTQGLIHYNFSVELPIQSFILPLCILFSDDTYEEHLAVITSSQMDARGRLSVSMILLLVRAGILNFT